MISRNVPTLRAVALAQAEAYQRPLSEETVAAKDRTGPTTSVSSGYESADGSRKRAEPEGMESGVRRTKRRRLQNAQGSTIGEGSRAGSSWETGGRGDHQAGFMQNVDSELMSQQRHRGESQITNRPILEERFRPETRDLTQALSALDDLNVSNRPRERTQSFSTHTRGASTVGRAVRGSPQGLIGFSPVRLYASDEAEDQSEVKCSIAGEEAYSRDGLRPNARSRRNFTCVPARMPPVSALNRTEDQDDPNPRPDIYEVSLTPDPVHGLGLLLACVVDGLPCIAEQYKVLPNRVLPAQAAGTICLGDELVAANGVGLDGRAFAWIVAYIRYVGRQGKPIRMCFRRRPTRLELADMPAASA
jgi:hypothetical protein